MNTRARMSRSLQLLLLLFTSSTALAQEQASVVRVNDAGIEWGACPAPLPQGCALAVLHGDPAKPNADVFLRIPGRSRIPLHTHTSPERMVLVEGKLSVTYEGQKMAVLLPGSYAYGPAGKPHSAACMSDKPCVLFIAFESPVDIKAVPKRE
ncbi:cupin domain-containing protein [Massilia sp. H6]|uniref:cupin domain-containing protein n=1 Tax=Massilia sp. H6 TaxID=2970464 RepID=UPI00216A46DD|nr:cupin domain-containing protein [Massilia sp. H6]UVW27247.1 cupin domain-containing protein [Massilia sp. H6]